MSLLLILGALAFLLGRGSKSDDESETLMLHEGSAPSKLKKAPDPKKPAAARALQALLKGGADPGSKAKPNAKIKALQAAMGSIKADGVTGPETRARAKELGYPLPSSSASSSSASSSSSSAPFAYMTEPSPTKPSVIITPKAPSSPSSPSAPLALLPKVSPDPKKPEAARALQALLKGGADPGSKAKPNAKIAALQARMGGLVADGITGDKTRARAADLGYPLPASKSAAKQPAPLPPAPAPKAAAKQPAALPPAPAPKPAATKQPALLPPAPAPKAAPAAAKPTAAKPATPAQSAARALDAYLQSGGRDRSKIADQQWAMGLDADGIPGSATRAEVQRLIGTAPKWAALSSSQVTGAVPGGASKRAAAERLERYRKFKGVNAARIAAYQRVLGVSADGKIGPKTQAAADAALGRRAAL